ncbi:MAG TPA: DNA-directed RNA polymerase subunit omega [Phycisphaerales bacterium]|nr:DNA-directed RNA polymerase subunit omega [Phycisphaerales bacterium]
MIEALKGEEVVSKVGGRFRLCALIQRRLVQLMDGARPLVDRDGKTDLEIVIEEIMQDRITWQTEEEAMADTSRGAQALPPPRPRAPRRAMAD